MNKIKRIVLPFSITVLIIAMLISPSISVKFAIEGFSVWFLYVLPSLFPFFFLSAILGKTGVFNFIGERLSNITQKVFNVNGIASYAAIMSYISGYPIGAKITDNLVKTKEISDNEALCVSLLSSTSGAVFIIGTIGGILLKNSLYGVLIYFCHILGAMITAYIFKPRNCALKKSAKIMVNTQKTLYEMTYDSVISILIVGGYITLFYVFYGLIEHFKLLFPLEYLLSCALSPFGENLGSGVISGIFECTQGIKKIATLSQNQKVSAILACFLISFGGLSINMQNLSFLSNTGIKKTTYLLGKVVHSIISTFLLSLIFVVF